MILVGNVSLSPLFSFSLSLSSFYLCFGFQGLISLRLHRRHPWSAMDGQVLSPGGCFLSEPFSPSSSPAASLFLSLSAFSFARLPPTSAREEAAAAAAATAATRPADALGGPFLSSERSAPLFLLSALIAFTNGRRAPPLLHTPIG